MNNKTVHMVSFVLLVVGGLNWGLIALFDLNLVDMVLGGMPMIAKLVYILVGLAAVYELFTHKKHCTMCS
jgi:uncharacterized protein